MFGKLLIAAGEFNTFADTLKKLFNSMFTPLMTIVGSLVAVWGIYLGVKFARSSGDENKRKEAKTAVLHFVIGIVVIFAVAGAAPLLIAALTEWLSSVQ